MSRDELTEVTRRMALTQNSWPYWPVLPLKRRDWRGPGLRPLGYLFAGANYLNGVLEVFQGNIFDPNPDKDPVIDRYLSVFELIEEWEVD